MYAYIWDRRTGGYLLTTRAAAFTAHEIRPVFAEELELTGMSERFSYPKGDPRPLLWAQKNVYLLNGEKVAELKHAQYGKPLTVEYAFEGKRKLKPVDVDAMIKKNSAMLDLIAADSVKRAKELYDKDISQCDIAYIAFSGGKDSAALLNICHEVLPLSVPVVFSDTDMELPDTYEVWDEVQKRYPDREFIKARAENSALDNWRLFGPPSRTIRWCCSVHKSTPALMYLKEKLHKSAIRAMAFVGVRRDESHSRSLYEDDSADGKKNASQINQMPILDWGAHELWLYIFANNLIINPAYKKGIGRIGCIMCPDASARYVWFANKIYPKGVKKYTDIIIDTSQKAFTSDADKQLFIDKADWSARKSGEVLKNTLSSPFENTEKLTTTFHSPFFSKSLFYEWIKTIGTLKETNGQQSLLLSSSSELEITFSYSEEKPGGKVVFHFSNAEIQKKALPLIRPFLRKVLSCIACGCCEAECGQGAIICKNGKIQINESKCIHCKSCYDIELTCWRFKSMFKSENTENSMRSINRYNHFGLRQNWLSVLLEMKNSFFPWNDSHPLGNKMVQSARAWFKEAGLTDSKQQVTPLLQIIEKFHVEDIQAWDFIWFSLSNNSLIVKWAVTQLEINHGYSRQEMFDAIQEISPELKSNSIEDGLTSLKETVSLSPLGGENGVGRIDFKGKQWVSFTRQAREVSNLVLLYGLYLIAHKANRSSFSVRELMTSELDSPFVSPIVAFGISPETFKRQCEGLRSKYPDYISTTFTFGNDGVDVYPDKYSVDDVLRLALEQTEY